MSRDERKVISDETISRRSVLEWLGKGTVLALGAANFACLAPHAAEAGLDIVDGPDASDSGADVISRDDDGGDVSSYTFPFEAGERTHPVYDGWGQRTVDRQDLESILSGWRLAVDGMVETPRVYTFADLVQMPRTDLEVDFHCVEGWSVLDVPWNGLHMSTIIDDVVPLSSASHITFHTIGDRYNESLPLPIALEPKTILGYGVGGYTLPLSHGFPLRVVIPRLLGYKNAKYVERLELTDHPVDGFWVAAGYDYDGEVPEHRLREGKY